MDKFIDMQIAQQFAKSAKEGSGRVTMFEYKGVHFAGGKDKREILEQLPDWEARPDDVFVVSFPKAGTTWTQEIVYVTLNNGDVEKAKKIHSTIRVPYIERPVKGQLPRGLMPFYLLPLLPSPRLLKSHLPQHLLPPSVLEKKAKVIYIARNPKDVAVSFYNFHKWQPLLPKYDSWSIFLEDFMAGKVAHGNCLDHCLGYWHKRHEENILFLKYEDMKKDEKAAVKQVSEFLGYQYSDEMVERITQHCSFDSMKKNPISNPDGLNMQRDEVKSMSFMRKGKVGDWGNYFTAKQNEVFDAMYQEKLAGTGLEFEFN